MATGRGQEFVVDDHAVFAPAAELETRLAAALEPRFTVVQEARRAVRRVWLDTFDWRLHAAGLTLAQVTEGRSGALVLSTCDGDVVAAGPPRPRRWPSRPEVLPAGPLRDRVGPVAEIRALLPLARTKGTVTRFRVLDAEQKTVVRITLDAASLARPDAAPLPVRLVITPVRGYQADADRAGKLLAAANGFTPAPGPAYLAVLAAAGRRPGDYTDKVDVTLSPSMPARAALAAVLLRLASTIAANADYVIRDVDAEFLHDLRVAVRRTRSALKLAGDALPGDLAARFAAEFKWLGDLTTPVRDLDVYLIGFDTMAAGLSAAASGDLEPLRAHLAARRAAEQRRLVRALRSARFRSLMVDWPAELEAAAARAGCRGPRIDSLAAERIARAHRWMAKRGAVITAVSGPAATGDGADPAAVKGGGPSGEELHALRKRGKELRYLLEFFGSLYAPAACRQVVKDLKGLQDCLGEFQDGEVQKEAIRGFAVQMIAGSRGAGTRGAGTRAAGELAATLLAMGELTARLDKQQARARGQIAARFTAFARADSLRRLGIAPASRRAAAR